MATIEDLRRLDVRVGRVLSAQIFPEARKPAWRLRIDFGPDIGVKQSAAQITHYPQEALTGRLVIAVVNLPPRRVAGFPSDVLVLGAMDPHRGVVLLQPDGDAEPGSPIA